MTPISRAALRFLASLVMALGVGSGVVAMGAWTLPRLLDSFGLDVWNLPRWLAVQQQAPAEGKRIQEMIGQISQVRVVKDEIARSVVNGGMNYQQGLTAFTDLMEQDPALRRRLEVAMPDLPESERVRLHYEMYLNSYRGVRGVEVLLSPSAL